MAPKDLLRKLIDDRYGGNQAAFSRAIKRQAAQVNQWLTGYRKLDTKGQRHIETMLGLPAGYMSGEVRYTIQPQAPLTAEEPRHARPLVQQVCDMAEQINDAGLNQLIGFATNLRCTHPIVKAKPTLSA